MRRTVTIAVLIASLTGAVATVRALDRVRARSTDDEVLYVPSAAVLRHASLGYTGLLADIYWTRAVQYFGAKHVMHARSYPMLAPLLDIATELDPQLQVAYEFGSIFLAQPVPEGAGEPVRAVELVSRGIRMNPNAWRLYYHLGYIQAMELHQYDVAAKTFEQGSNVPGAHPWMKVVAATMAQHGGEAQMARYLWSRIYESADDPMIKKSAAEHLRALQVEDDLARLEALVEQFRAKNKRVPATFSELGLRGAPADPLGHPYRLAQDGHVYVQDAHDLPFLSRGVPQP